MKHQTKAIWGGFMGNVVEAYDMSLCYFLSRELAQYLLGDSSGKPTIVLSLIFISYLAKPIGAFILGLFSDLYGRKNILTISILIMGFASASIGFIPGFGQIGIGAALLLLLFRIIQSMALGAEFLNSASFLVESGDNKNRGFRGCWSSVGVKAGYLVACLVVEGLHYFAGDNIPRDLLWRIPFVLALITTLLGFYIRYRMPESLDYVLYYADNPKPTTRDIYKSSLAFLKQSPFLFNYAFFASFLSVATGFFFYLYIPIHAAQYSQMSAVFIMNSNIASLVVVTVLIPLFGILSDKIDRLKMLTFATSGLLILSYPYMHAINYGSAFSFLFMQLLISIPCACYYSVSTVILTELFPLPIRCTTLSIVFSVAASLASGLPPLLSDYLTRVTGQPSSPAWIMFVLTFIVLINIKVLIRNYRLGVNHYKIGEVWSFG